MIDVIFETRLEMSMEKWLLRMRRCENYYRSE